MKSWQKPLKKNRRKERKELIVIYERTRMHHRNQWRNGTYFVKQYLNGQEGGEGRKKEKALGLQHM